MGKFRQIFTELSAHDTIMAGYYSLTFLFFSGLLSCLVGIKTRTSMCFTCRRDNSPFPHYLKNPSIMPLGVFLV